MGKINISWRYISFLCASEEEEHLVLSGYGERFGLFQGTDHHWELSSCLHFYLPAIFKSRQEHWVSCPLFRTGVVNTQQLPWNTLDPQRHLQWMLVNIPHLQQGPTPNLSPADCPSTGLCLNQTLMVGLYWFTSLQELPAEAKVVNWYSGKTAGDKKWVAVLQLTSSSHQHPGCGRKVAKLPRYSGAVINKKQSLFQPSGGASPTTKTQRKIWKRM